jgi:RNA polymerase sigma factor (sigma-70 family)
VAELSELIEGTVRRERARILGGLVRLSGSLDAAEEAFQEATLAALHEWTDSGAPANPGAWLMTVAKNRARDMRRHRAVAEAKSALILEDEMDAQNASSDIAETIDTITDDYLRLVLACCHPELGTDNQIALTLKVVCGFSTEEIARAFVCSEDTISQRVLRAKETIEKKQLAYALPAHSEIAQRVVAALGVVYAMFNEGHTSRSGPLMRVDLQAEALRLGRLLGDLVPQEPEVFGLIAIMAFGAARARTRVDEEGVPILLSVQDRSHWDRPLLREGLTALQRTRSLGGRGPYVLQAGIAACHVTAPRWEETDWRKILGLYDELLAPTRSPIVALNRAIAVSMCHGPEAALRELAPLEAPLASYHLFYATRADFEERAGMDARADLRRALDLATNEGERKLLERRLGASTSVPPSIAVE